MGSNSERLCLRWNDFESNIKNGFSELRQDSDFYDVTLACGSQQIKAHKVILSACSPFFRHMIKAVPHQHPLLYLRGVKFNHLENLLSFMYNGEVNVTQDDLNSFLALAEELKVRGLTQQNSNHDNSEKGDNNKRPRPPAAAAKLTHPPSKRPRPDPPKEDPDDEDEEIIPQDLLDVKSEPKDGNNSNLIVEDANEDGSTLADDYLEEENYDDYGQYENESYGMDDSLGAPVAGPSGGAVAASADGNKGFLLRAPTEQDIKDNIMRLNPFELECIICKKRAREIRVLFSHVEAEHFGINVFYCDICNKMYKSREKLRAHKKYKHKNFIINVTPQDEIFQNMSSGLVDIKPDTAQLDSAQHGTALKK